MPKRTKNKKQLSRSELKESIRTTMDFMIRCFETNKHLINESDILDKCFKNNKDSFEKVMKRVTSRFNRVYNYNIVEVDTYATLLQSRKYFPIFNENTRGLWRSLVLNEHQKNYILLLSFTLTHIAGTEEPCHEDTLWTFFEALNISLKKKHPRFGNIKERILNEFTKHMYIDKLPAPNGVLLSWGFRAYKEFDRHYMKCFILAVIKGKPGTTVKEVYQKACRMVSKPDITLT